MFPAAMRVLHIKDLKDLRAFCGRGAIDMQDLKDLKRFFHVNDRGGQAPALRYARPSPFHRRARACPSPCLDREENGVGLRAVFARVERSRGTGPRATGPEGVLFAMRRSGSGAPELQSPALILLILLIVILL